MLSGELSGVRVRQAWQAELGRLAVEWFGEEEGEENTGQGDGEGAQGGGVGGGSGAAGAEEPRGEAGLTEEEEEQEAMARFIQAQAKGDGATGD